MDKVISTDKPICLNCYEDLVIPSWLPEKYNGEMICSKCFARLKIILNESKVPVKIEIREKPQDKEPKKVTNVLNKLRGYKVE